APVIRFCCPQCETKLRAPEDKVGAKVACPKCGHRVLVPSAAVDADLETDESPPQPAAKRKVVKRPRQKEPTGNPKRISTVLLVSIVGGISGALVVGGMLLYALKAGTNIPGGIRPSNPAPGALPTAQVAKHPTQPSPMPEHNAEEQPRDALEAKAPSATTK